MYEENKEKITERDKKYREKNRTKINESNKKRYYEKYREDRLKNFDPSKRAEYHIVNKERENKQAIERYRKLRLDAITHYGGKCAYCGDTNINNLIFT